MNTDLNPNYPPPTPAEISVFVEAGRYVFRTTEGAAIYTFAGDANGHSACLGQCAKTWPALIAEPPPRPIAGWTTHERSDNSLQWVYKSKPLYTYALDEPGKAMGLGVDGMWRLVEP